MQCSRKPTHDVLKNKKKPRLLRKHSKEEEEMLGDQPYDDNDLYRRGDIPIIHTDNCDGK
jgi:hypothetical protein